MEVKGKLEKAERKEEETNGEERGAYKTTERKGKTGAC